MTRSQTGLLGLPFLLAACATTDTASSPAVATTRAERLRCEAPTGSHYPRCDWTDNMKVISRENVERSGTLLGDDIPTAGAALKAGPGAPAP